MPKNQRFPVGFPPIVRKVIKDQVGTIGNSEAEVVKNIVLIYFTERKLLRKNLDNEKSKGGKFDG